MKAGESPSNQGRTVWAPLSVSRRRSRGLRKTPRWSAERRAGPRYGPAIPSADGIGSTVRRANGRGVPCLRISALRYPHLEGRRVRNRQFGTTARRDAPRGNAPAWHNTCTEKITMLKFTHLPLHVMRGHSRPKDGVATLAYDPGIHEASLHCRPYGCACCASSWIAGSSPAMTNVRVPTRDRRKARRRGTFGE